MVATWESGPLCLGFYFYYCFWKFRLAALGYRLVAQVYGCVRIL
jgi:hypothetical protein